MHGKDTTAPSPDERNAIGECFARHPEISVVYLFGSVARGEARPDSDLDLGIVFRERGVTAREIHPLLGQLSTEISRVMGHDRIDLVLLEPQGPIFCHRVLLEGQLLYEGDRNRRVDFESNTLVRAFDFRPTWELAIRGKTAGLRRWLRQTHDLR